MWYFNANHTYHQNKKQTEGWALVSEHGTTKTYFQPVVGGENEEGEGHLVRVRVEGRVDCSVMEQVNYWVVEWDGMKGSVRAY
jgi:hypothetical protein